MTSSLLSQLAMRAQDVQDSESVSRRQSPPACWEYRRVRHTALRLASYSAPGGNVERRAGLVDRPLRRQRVQSVGVAAFRDGTGAPEGRRRARCVRAAALAALALGRLRVRL